MSDESHALCAAYESAGSPVPPGHDVMRHSARLAMIAAVMSLVIASGCAPSTRIDPAPQTDAAVATTTSPQDADVPEPGTPDQPPQSGKTSTADDGQQDPTPDRPTSLPPPSEPQRIDLPEEIVVFPQRREVHLPAWVCLDQGWLEQVACSPGTREHESLVIVTATPSSIHSALLLAGFEPGQPGWWSYDWETETFDYHPPTGSEVEVFVRYERVDNGGATQVTEHPIREWIADHRGRATFPNDTPFVFGGSRFARHPDRPELGEHYVADISGSIIGLVTFGDEMIGFREVIADQVAVHAPEWVVNVDAIPPVNTHVTLIVRPWARDDQ